MSERYISLGDLGGGRFLTYPTQLSRHPSPHFSPSPRPAPMAYYNNPNDSNFPFTSTPGGSEEYPLPTSQPVVDQFSGQVHIQNQLLPVDQTNIRVHRLAVNRRGTVPGYHPYQKPTSSVPRLTTTVGQAANFGKHRSGILVNLSPMGEPLGSAARSTTYSSSSQDHDQSSWSDYRWPGVVRQPQYEHLGSSYPAVPFAGSMTASGSSTAISTPGSGKHYFLFVTLRNRLLTDH